jgi:hypothetical protein
MQAVFDTVCLDESLDVWIGVTIRGDDPVSITYPFITACFIKKTSWYNWN